MAKSSPRIDSAGTMAAEIAFLRDESGKLTWHIEHPDADFLRNRTGTWPGSSREHLALFSATRRAEMIAVVAHLKSLPVV